MGNVWGVLVVDGEAPGQLTDTRGELFARLTDRELDRSFRVACLILGDRADAEDAVHDALESAWRRWHTVRDPERFEAWFGRIVTNSCRDRARRRRVAPITVSVVPEQEATDELGGLPERELLRQGLRSLDIDHRIVLVLRYYEDLAIDEIAARLDERPGTVRSRIHYGLRALRASLDSAERLGREVER